jgi:hypothetical protein
MRGRPRSAIVAVVLVALLLAAAGHASDAHLWVVWRLAQLSWDSPASQLYDAQALQGAVYTDHARRTHEDTLAAWHAASVLGLPASSRRAASAVCASPLTRSPPVA